MNCHKKILFNDRGVSLVGVLAAAGLLGVIIMSAMTVSNNMMQAARTVDIKAEVQSEIFLAQALLSTESNCTVNFKGLPIGVKPRTFNANGGKLFLSTKPGIYTLGKSPIFASQNSKTSNVILNSIDYKLYPDSEDVMILSLEFKPRGNILGGSIRDREIPLKVLIANNKVESCVAMGVPSLNVSEEDSSSGGQGKGCAQLPSGVDFDKTSLEKAFEDICEMQKYPVKEGVKISRESLEDCIKVDGWGVHNGQGMSKQCHALITLATTEGEQWNFPPGGVILSSYGRNFFKKGRILKTRNGYKSKAECLKQRPFSEGDNVAGKVCVNGRWTSGRMVMTSAPIYQEINTGSKNGSHDHNPIGD